MNAAAPSDELVSLSATRLAELVRTGEVSSVEVVEAHVRRIARVNPLVNAVVQLDADRALREASTADAVLSRAGTVGPLHGVPFTAKDNIETEQLVTAVGVAERKDVRPERDALVVARMRAAGAILLGKTNCPPWGGGSVTDNPVYGRTNNPYDLERTPGGSSGGEAAAIAAGASPCGLGTDSGGSLRQPAHFCGVACLKPTATLVPVSGILDDEGELGAIGDPRTQVGPLARTVEDVALVLSVIAGADRHDPDVPPVELRDPTRVALRGLRAAVHVRNEVSAAQPVVTASITAAAEVLSDAGVLVEDRPLPPGGYDLTERIWASYGGRMRSDELYRVMRDWDAYRRRLLGFMDACDLLLCPAFDAPAPTHRDAERPDCFDGVSFTTPFSLTGWPAAVVRAGTSDEGLPIGVQLVARPWRDDVALAAAARVEEALGGWLPPPLELAPAR
jgi:amidase